MGDDHPVCNETSGVARPTLENRKPGQVWRFNDFLTRRRPDFSRVCKQSAFDKTAASPKPFERRWIQVLDSSEQLIAYIQRIAAQRGMHAAGSSEKIHHQRHG